MTLSSAWTLRLLLIMSLGMASLSLQATTRLHEPTDAFVDQTADLSADPAPQAAGPGQNSEGDGPGNLQPPPVGGPGDAPSNDAYLKFFKTLRKRNSKPEPQQSVGSPQIGPSTPPDTLKEPGPPGDYRDLDRRSKTQKHKSGVPKGWGKKQREGDGSPTDGETVLAEEQASLASPETREPAAPPRPTLTPEMTWEDNPEMQRLPVVYDLEAQKEKQPCVGPKCSRSADVRSALSRTVAQRDQLEERERTKMSYHDALPTVRAVENNVRFRSSRNTQQVQAKSRVFEQLPVEAVFIDEDEKTER